MRACASVCVCPYAKLKTNAYPFCLVVTQTGEKSRTNSHERS